MRAILRKLGAAPTRVLEPFAGRGAIVRAVLDHWSVADVHAVELDPARAGILKSTFKTVDVECGDFFATSYDGGFDLGITNPPFEAAIPGVLRMFEGCRETVALLRLNMLGSMDRIEFWRKHPADVYVLSKRPSFCASLKCGEKRKCDWKQTMYLDQWEVAATRPKVCGGCGGKLSVITTDSCEYAWFVWGPGRGNRWEILQVAAP